VPQAWAPFWSFWCDQVQPALRQALGRDDVWGVGLAMSSGGDTMDALEQFIIANSAYLWPETGSSLDDPTFHSNLIKSVDSYTAIWRKSCTPTDAPAWQYPENNKAFLEQRVVMTLNTTLSIPGALWVRQPEDYYEHTATIDWPEGPNDRVFPLIIGFLEAVVFADGRNVAGAKRFLSFLLSEDWLGASLEAAGGRYMPLIVEDLGKPFWTDPADPHLRTAVEQLAGPIIPDWGPIRRWQPEWDPVQPRQLMAEAVHRVVTEGISPEQAVDEAIARIKQVLREKPGAQRP
jgi:multiple sugar transport system substrate-binding protein